MRETRDAEILRIPFIVPSIDEEGDKAVIAYYNGALLETEIEPGVPAGWTAVRFLENFLEHTNAQMLGTIGKIDNICGHAVHPAPGQSFEIPNYHRGILKAHSIAEYIADENRRHSFFDIYLVQQAVERSRSLS